MTAHIDIYIQGVKGKEFTPFLNKGRCQIYIGGVPNKIEVDAFQGQGDSYKRREDSLITISNGSYEFFSGTFEELRQVLEKSPKPGTISVSWAIEDLEHEAAFYEESNKKDFGYAEDQDIVLFNRTEFAGILQEIEHCHDANIGINWDVLRSHLTDELYSTKYFAANGYWKDSGLPFENYLFYVDEEIQEEDESIFFYGLSLNDLKDAVEQGEDWNNEFVITSFCPRF